MSGKHSYPHAPQFDTTPPPVPVTYPDQLAASVGRESDPGYHPIALGKGIPVTLDELLNGIVEAFSQADKDPTDAEVFVAIDRVAMHDIIEGKTDPTHLLPRTAYMWPAVLRVDEFGDLIIHVTTGDLAQNGVQS